MSNFAAVLRGFIALAALNFVVSTFMVFILTGTDLPFYRYFAPKREAARREVFEETKSYNQGMVQELDNMRFEWVKADDAHKQALGSIILHRAADYPEDRMPADLRDFIRSLRSPSTQAQGKY